MVKFRKLFAVSLILNFFFLTAGLYIIIRRGGMNYVISTLNPKPVVPFLKSPLYLGRKNYFSSLPKRDRSIVFLGDSLVDFAELNETFASSNTTIINRGILADTVDGVRERVDEVARHNPTKIFLSVGINDLLQKQSVESVLNSYKQLILELRLKCPNSKIFVQSVFPLNREIWKDYSPTEDEIKVLNGELLKLENDKQILFLDIYSQLVDETAQMKTENTTDGVHLSGVGYKKISEILNLVINAN